MKSYHKIFYSLLIFILIILTGCKEEPTPSLFSDVPTGPIGATPTITSITPADSALAGSDLITITGTNFSPVISSDLVFFNKRQVPIISATSTTILLKAPNLLSDTSRFEAGNFRISTIDAELFSNEVKYKLNPAVFQIFGFTQFQKPYDFVIDASTNLFVSMTNELNVGQGVKEITSDGTLNNYAPKGTEGYWIAMRFGPGGIIITARQDNARALFQVPAGGGAPSTYVVISDSKAKVSSLDFDSMNNLWVGGNNSSIYKVKTDNSVTSYPYTGDISALRIFNNNLYAAVKTDSSTVVQSFPIDANGDLGNASEYYDYSQNYGSKNVNAIEFSVDGSMYLATDNVNSPIIVVHSDKSSQILFPGTLAKAPALFLYWGPNGYLYYTRGQVVDPATGVPTILQTILRLTIGIQGAPYYGQ
jgi:hypothetical protein